ncbi:MAG: hypothetical protein SV062_02280 [Thermodesulfobacteriota bacterium]|nr:hypothetical protein [Thermodesulfobacteriota bacterium]
MMLRGINSSNEDVRKIAALAKEICPDRIQLNTVVRPQAEDFAAAVSKEQMGALTDLFHPAAEIVAEFSTGHAENIQANQDTILSMLQCRPCTADDIADVFDMHLNEVAKYPGKLIRTKVIRVEQKDKSVCYSAVIGEDKEYRRHNSEGSEKLRVKK